MIVGTQCVASVQIQSRHGSIVQYDTKIQKTECHSELVSGFDSVFCFYFNVHEFDNLMIVAAQ